MAPLDPDAASEAKSAFLDNMSHEIRTPLNAVLGFLQLLRDTELNSRQQGYLGKAMVSARHLHGILGDILDFSRIEAGSASLEILPFDPRETLDRVAGILAQRAREKGLGLRFDLDPLPERILGDPERLGQVLLSLGGNAVKFTPAGEVRVAVRVLASSREAVRLRFEVSDTGIGIHEAQLDKLFQPFSQADDSSTRRFGGIGLGLASSRRLAQLMGGGIEVTSRPGQGSRFAMELGFPLAPAGRVPGGRPAQAPGDGAELPLRGLNVLLAEDDVMNQQLGRQILRRAGARVSLAGSGQEALDRLREQPFDVVLMDLQMPGMGGLEAAAEIRKEPRWAGMPIIALTADGLPGVREQVLAAGMTGYLCKPMDRAGLIGILARLAPAPVPEAPPNPGPEQVAEIPGVDTRGALVRLGLGPEAYLRFLRRFGMEQAAVLLALRAALERADPVTARRLAHSMKGTALTIGAEHLAAGLRGLEARLETDSGEDWRALLEPVEERLEAITAWLARVPAAEPRPAVETDWPAVQEALEALRRALTEDDAKAGRDLARLEALIQGGPLQEALIPMKGWVQTYEFRRALELLPGFLDQVALQRAGA